MRYRVKVLTEGEAARSGELLTWGKSYKELFVADTASTTTASNPHVGDLTDKIEQEYRCYVVDQAGDQIKDVEGRPDRRCGKPPNEP
jgi:hypothetical protein